MTQEEKDRLAYQISVMQAFAEGKEIEYSHVNNCVWHTIRLSQPLWNWEDCNYRIKPKTEREYIDLGLPSGTLWATENEEGFYTFDEANEKFGENMPLKEDGEELFRECFHRWDDKRKGIEILSPFNGNRLFFPALGYRSYGNGKFYSAGSNGNYWFGSPLSSNLNFYSYSLYVSNLYNRAFGFSVRCVKHIN